MSAWTTQWPYLIAALLVGVCVGMATAISLMTDWRMR